MTHKRRTFSAEFKRDALDLWRNTDRSAKQVESELGLTEGILYKWQQKQKRDGQVGGKVASMRFGATS